MKILSVENLSRSFGGIKANDDISFNVDEGSILGIIGPNGAGKSTLFDLITGYTKADTGKIEFFEKNIFGLSPDKISNLGVGRTFDRLVKEKNQIVSRKILPISLSYDHRLIDGAEGARFCVYLGKCLGKDFAFKLAV